MTIKQKVTRICLLVIGAVLLFYAYYPAVNFHSLGFWIYAMVVVSAGILLFGKEKDPTGGVSVHAWKQSKRRRNIGNHTPLQKVEIMVFACVCFWGILMLVESPLFRSGTYAQRIEVMDVEFSSIPAYSFNRTAIIDRDSAEQLGDKVMGEMSDLVSQFDVSQEYAQISYREGTYRVTPLAYDGIIKYFRNRKAGIPGYILVNTTTGSAKLVRLEERMRYVPSAWFHENLYRHLRFSYPMVLFGNPTFEIDDEGKPWYVCTTYTYTGFRSLKRVTGLILVDPVDGSSTRYGLDDIPSWVDRVFPEDLVETELNDYGRYQKGFFNSIFSQEGVIQTSEGYNYISKDGDIWLYTGMTSVVSDDSNIGFMLVDLRTHEAQFIATSGADEYSVMASAEGEVLNYGYTATFPVLVNIQNRPVYILSLKDSAGLVKMYAMVDARDYQQVYTIKADKNSETALNALIASFLGTNSAAADSTVSTTITVADWKIAVIDGNTFVYLEAAAGDVYRVQLTQENAAAFLFLSPGDVIDVDWYEDGNERVIVREKVHD